MNSMINCSRLLATVLCGAVLAACDSIQDVREEPYTAVPAVNAVLGGSIRGLGSIRPLILQNNGADVCLVLENPNTPAGPKIVSECKFYGIPDEEYSTFSLGARPVGSPYSITVKSQPFGKICTVANPTGTVGAGSDEIQITCENDPAVSRYTVTANIDPAASARAGLKVILTTENGTCPVEATGQSSFTFDPSLCPNTPGGFHQNATQLFNNGTSLPTFGWRVTATIPGATVIDAPTNCFVTGGPVTNTGGNIDDDGKATTAPTGNVTVNVVSCAFVVRAQADFFPSASPPAIPGGEAISLVLREQPTGVDVAAARITAFADTYIPFMEIDSAGNPTATQYDARSQIDAFYEVIVTGSPTGMTCIPGNSVTGGSSSTSTRTRGNWTDGGGVLLRRPASAYVRDAWLIDRVIRCRAAPAVDVQLRGVYQQTAVTTRTATRTGVAPEITVTTVRNHNFLALFEDGQYLYGQHIASAANNGVEQGFYNYNSGTGQIVFTAFTDTNGGSGLHSVATAGSPVPKTITSVVRSQEAGRNVIRGRYSSATANGLSLSGGLLTVAVGSGVGLNVASGPHTTLTGLASAINTAGLGLPIAAVSGDELLITGPAGGVVFGGSAAETLGLGTVAAGATALSMGAGSAVSSVVVTTVDWTLTEVGADPLVATTNIMDGAWVTWDTRRQVEDRRRVMVYQHSLYNLFHMGVNGIPNLQEACYVGDFGLEGFWTRQGGRSGCNMRIYTNVVRNDGSAPTETFSLMSSSSSDIPNPTAVLRDYPGRWPQSRNPDFTDGRPYSVVDYQIRLAGSEPADPICPGADKLTVWDTAHGTRKSELDPPIPPIVLCRMSVN